MFGGLLTPQLPSIQKARYQQAVSEAPTDSPARLSTGFDGNKVGSTELAPAPKARSPLALAPREQGAGTLAQAASQQQQAQLIRDIIREEIGSIRKAEPPPAPARPVQLIINNHAEAVSQSAPPPPPPPKREDSFQELLVMFFGSTFNRVCLFSALSLGLYMYQGHLSHRWRMDEYQRRIDANIVLRLWRAIGPPPK
eukprot:TRINITY_DN10704_c0_g1_i1.p1 TRINITY_DN10704_c0_g1~~TRINITY_DN10704_c0_g1_i1.p1  ORF type:complete len:197 (-),score=53.63 TRINITY_DN10704_c0_g1_i1:202-792(-)